MLGNSEVHANVPASDLQRARDFYVDKLGLTPMAEDEETVRFSTPSGSWFQLYRTEYAGTGKHTLAQWDVEDLSATVQKMADAGVGFETYDIPGVTWDGFIASMGDERVAWFTDTEGNVMCLDQRTSS